ncbi:MAG: hypothetical protein LBI42_15850 [Chitinispirillales bacterium]|jgi:hypothetical protein|nr:hypothetical protein [Chitinispirillales bacterium]
MKNTVCLTSRLKHICLCVLATAFTGFSYIETKVSSETHTFSESEDNNRSWGLIESFNRASIALKRSRDTVNYIEAGITVNAEIQHNDWYLFEGGMKLRLSAGMQDIGPLSWQLQAASMETFTVGNGLTIKELTGYSKIGARASALGFNLLSVVYGNASWYYRDSVYGYKHRERILCTELSYSPGFRYTAGINSLLFVNSTLNRNGFYLLPFARFNMGDISVYGEVGTKTQWRDNGEEREYKNAAAALAGVEVSKNLREFNFSVNAEFRYYSSDFTMGFNHVPKYYISYYYNPVNNWIYFGNERWYYTNIRIESPPLIKNVIFLAGTEIMALDDFSRIVYFYSGGLKWPLSNSADFKFMLTNKLPYLSYAYGRCPEFKTSKHPSALFSLGWHMTKSTKKRSKTGN